MKKLIVTLIVLAALALHTLCFAATQPLPPNLIALSSPAGGKIFNRSYSPAYFWPLTLQFVTQQNRAYCSIASSVMVLNALDVTAPNDAIFAPYNIFTQDNFFTPTVQRILPQATVSKMGATLTEISRALATYPVTVQTFHANQFSAAQFRERARQVIDSRHGYIIVNFLRSGLSEAGTGHMSPLAAYDKISDRFLLLDVARYRYPSVWVKTQDLWKAMHTIDDGDHTYRGFLIVQKGK